MGFIGCPIVLAVLCWAILLALTCWLGALNLTFLWTSGTGRSFNYLAGYQPAQGPDFQVQITVAVP